MVSWGWCIYSLRRHFLGVTEAEEQVQALGHGAVDRRGPALAAVWRSPGVTGKLFPDDHADSETALA